ncbi:MAG TPA: hypothetical protein PKM59_14180 [Thermodesulfobacteriota bacterium]|nr:hypothetical protein [Myxococcota bacterium]HNR14450.1 hypothetical protein [Thermodesulfobacteriota bacterium]
MNNNDDPYNMSSKSIDELLRVVCGRNESAMDHQYAKIELKKREMQRQHELNETILLKQHRLNLEITKIQTKTLWRATIFGAICAILGGLAGVYLTVTLSQHPSENLLQHQTQVKQELIRQETSAKKHDAPILQEKIGNEELQNNKKEIEALSRYPTKNE